MSPLLNGKQQRMGVENYHPPGIKIPWSIASLRPAPPLYSCKGFGKADLLDSGNSMRICSKFKNLKVNFTSRYRISGLISEFFFLDERLFEEDAIILRVIEGYCATVNTRLTVHSGKFTNIFLVSIKKKKDELLLFHTL